MNRYRFKVLQDLEKNMKEASKLKGRYKSQGRGG